MSGVAQAQDSDVDAVRAAGPPVGAICSETAGTHACFEKSGDKFWVKDTKADGHYSAMLGSWGPIFQGDMICRNKSGSDVGWMYCDFSSEIPEHSKVWFRADTMEGDGIVSSGGVVWSWSSD
ncbi:hypothetical protein ACWGH5_22740 [Streptomyces sp. NPDC054864]